MNFLSDLHAGRAGESLASADILFHGYDCFPSAQGMPYDLVMDVGGRLLRVQVKSTRKPEDMTWRNVNRMAYRFWVSRCGKGGADKYTETDVDLFALVALDTREVGYISVHQMVKTLFVRPESLRGTHSDEVAAVRNDAICSALSAGASVRSVAEDFGMSTDNVRKIQRGTVAGHVFGVYMKDLTLSSALGALLSGDKTRLGSKEANAAWRAADASALA